MSNLDRPAGLKPIKNLNGSPWSGKANVYYIPVGNATNLFVGDAVQSTGTADETGKYPGVEQADLNESIRGVIIGFGDNPNVMVHPDTPNRSYCPDSTEMYCWVVDDPFVIFEVQEDSDGGALAVTAVGTTVDLVLTAGSTTTGKSGMKLDSSDTGTDDQHCRLLRVVDREDNALGTNCKWEVLISLHELLATADV